MGHDRAVWAAGHAHKRRRLDQDPASGHRLVRRIIVIPESVKNGASGGGGAASGGGDDEEPAEPRPAPEPAPAPAPTRSPSTQPPVDSPAPRLPEASPTREPARPPTPPAATSRQAPANNPAPARSSTSLGAPYSPSRASSSVSSVAASLPISPALLSPPSAQPLVPLATSSPALLAPMPSAVSDADAAGVNNHGSGPVIGGVIGAVVVIGLALVLALCLARRAQQQKRARQSEMSQLSTNAAPMGQGGRQRAPSDTSFLPYRAPRQSAASSEDAEPLEEGPWHDVMLDAGPPSAAMGVPVSMVGSGSDESDPAGRRFTVSTASIRPTDKKSAITALRSALKRSVNPSTAADIGGYQSSVLTDPTRSTSTMPSNGLIARPPPRRRNPGSPLTDRPFDGSFEALSRPVAAPAQPFDPSFSALSQPLPAVKRGTKGYFPDEDPSGKASPVPKGSLFPPVRDTAYYPAGTPPSMRDHVAPLAIRSSPSVAPLKPRYNQTGPYPTGQPHSREREVSFAEPAPPPPVERERPVPRAFVASLTAPPVPRLPPMRQTDGRLSIMESLTTPEPTISSDDRTASIMTPVTARKTARQTNATFLSSWAGDRAR